MTIPPSEPGGGRPGAEPHGAPSWTEPVGAPSAPAPVRVGVAIPAAGMGARMGGRKKAFLTLDGEPILLHTLRPFLRHPQVTAVVIALPADDADAPPSWLQGLDPRLRIVAGGESRLASVYAALRALPGDVEVAVVHDAARPLVTRGILDRCIGGTEGGVGAVAGWPSTDTLKAVDPGGWVVQTPDRTGIQRAQTPQAFPLSALLEACRRALDEGALATDDASVFERAGGRVRMVPGAAWNLKVTHPEDVPIAEFLLRRQCADEGEGMES